jgi:hypothetical protein
MSTYTEAGCEGMSHAKAMRITGGTCLWQPCWFSIIRMSMRSMWVWIALVIITLGLALLWGGPLGVTQAMGKYLWPTTVKLMPLPSDCVPSGEAPSTETLRIVEYQRTNGAFIGSPYRRSSYAGRLVNFRRWSPILLCKYSTRAHAENGCPCTSAVAAISTAGTWR